MITIPEFRITYVEPVADRLFTPTMINGQREDMRVRVDICDRGRGERIILFFGDIDDACHEIMEVYRASLDPEDQRHFKSWEDLMSFYEDHEWLGDSELGDDYFDEE